MQNRNQDERRWSLILAFAIAALVGLSRKTAAHEPFLQDDSPLTENGSSVSAMFVLGDSSVDCGDNTLFYTFLHRNLSLHPCNGSDSTLIPSLLAQKIGLPYALPFYSQNGTIKGLLNGLNFGSALATIMNLNPHQNHQSLDQQLRQAFETFQLLQLHLGQSYAFRFIRSSLFVLSFGRDDYLNLYSARLRRGGDGLARLLVNRVVTALRNLYDANVRRMLVMGVLPLGCSPRMIWQWYNFTGGDDDSRSCVNGINQLAFNYNSLLERRVAELNMELADAQIVFCDVYQGIMEIVSNPNFYGFEDARKACCGIGWHGGMSGCMSMELACSRDSTYVWWDFYNPTRAVNSLLADSAWSGQPLPDICRPVTIKELVSTSASFLS